MQASLPLLPAPLRVLTAELLARLQHADTAASALSQVDTLFAQKQAEYIEADGFVSPDEGFKALLHELVWTVTFSSPAGIGRSGGGDSSAASGAEQAFASASRALVLDVLQRNMDVSATPSAPSIAQIALVDVLWLVWTELEQQKPAATASAVAAAPGTPATPPTAAAAGAPPAVSAYTQSRERFIPFMNELLHLKKSVSAAPSTPSADAAADASALAASVSVNLLPARALKETFPVDLLDTLSIFGAAVLSKQMVTVRTSAWYRQQKFNLLREETEGFAKLFTEACTFFSLPATSCSVSVLQRKVFSFIGFFDLDPNRVIDILLDAFERSGLAGNTGQLANFLAVLDGFNRNNLVQILGFKFRNYYESALQAQTLQAAAAAAAAAGTGAATGTATATATGKNASSLGPAPQSLFDLAALLIKTGRISIEALYAHLSPSDELMALARSDLLAAEKDRLAKQNVVSLKKGGDDEPAPAPAPAAAPPTPNKSSDKSGDKGKATASSSSHQQQQQQLSNISSAVRNDASILSFGAGEEKKEEISLVLSGTPIPAMQTVVIERPAPDASTAAATAAAAAAAAATAAMPPPMVKSGIRQASQSTAPAAAAAPAPVASPAPAPAPAPPAPFPHPPNQKFQLLAALLNQNAFLPAEALWTHLEPLNPAATASVGQALVDFAARMLRPLYAPLAAEYMRFGKPDPRAAAASAAGDEPVLPSPLADFSHSINCLPPPGDPMAPCFAWVLLTDSQVEDQFTPGSASLDAYLAALPALMRVLKKLGIYLCNDALLWTRLCRVVAYIVKASKARMGPSGVVTAPGVLRPFELDRIVEDLIAENLLPAFALMPSAHGYSEELWAILKLLPFEMRYRLYGYWQNTLYGSCAEMAQLRASILYRARYFRKRIAAAKVKECSRLLLKFGENNPILVFDLLLQQIQSFDNMIAPVTDLVKLCHPLAMDALSFVLLSQIGQDKPRLSEDGVNENRWLQSLSTFAGVLFRKYTDFVDAVPAFFLYVLAQLKNEQSHDLLLMKEIIVHMTNIEIHEDVAEAEMEGRSGGRLLQSETTTVRDKSVKSKERQTRILVDSLAKYQLSLPLWVAMAQQKDFILFRFESEHVKVSSELYDKTHEALLHLVALLDQSVKDDQAYAAHFLPVDRLVNEYRTKPADAFHALRRVLAIEKMQGSSGESDSGSGSSSSMEVDGEERKSGAGSSSAAANSTSAALTISAPYTRLISSVRSFLPSSVWNAITPTFYALFWRLSLSHLHVPKFTYESHSAKLRALMPALENATTTQGLAKTDAQKRAGKVEKDRLSKLIKDLSSELAIQTDLVAANYTLLKAEKDLWFDSSLSAPEKSMSTFLEVCVLPRVLYSGLDAHFCSRFLRTLTRMDTPHFLYVDFFEQLCKVVGGVISSASVNEASRFGRFLNEMLGDLHSFAFDKDRFARRVEKSPKCFASKVSDPSSAPISFAHLGMNVMKWHLRLSKMFDRALSAAAGSSKSEINSALLILCKIGSEYPRTHAQGCAIERHLEVLMHAGENKNSAIKLMATRSHAQLQAQKKTWTGAPPAAAVAKPASSSSTATAASGTAASASVSSAAKAAPRPVKTDPEPLKGAPATQNAAAAKKLHAALAKNVAPTTTAAGKDEPKRGSDASSSARGGDKVSDSGRDGGGRSDARSADNRNQQQQQQSNARSSPVPTGDTRGRGREREREEVAPRDSKGGASDRIVDRDARKDGGGGMSKPSLASSSSGSNAAGGSGGRRKSASPRPGSSSKLNPSAREFTPSPAKGSSDKERAGSGMGGGAGGDSRSSAAGSGRNAQTSASSKDAPQGGGKGQQQPQARDDRRDDRRDDSRRDDKPIPRNDDRTSTKPPTGAASSRAASDDRGSKQQPPFAAAAARDDRRDDRRVSSDARDDRRDAAKQRDSAAAPRDDRRDDRSSDRSASGRDDRRGGGGDVAAGASSSSPAHSSSSHSRSRGRDAPRDSRDSRDAPLREQPRDSRDVSGRDGRDSRDSRDSARDAPAAAAAASGKRKRDDDRAEPAPTQPPLLQHPTHTRGGDAGQGHKRPRHEQQQPQQSQQGGGGGGRSGGGGGGGQHQGGDGGGGGGHGRRGHGGGRGRH